MTLRRSLAVAAALLVIVLAAFGIDRARTEGVAMRHVTVDGAAVGGASAADIAERVRAREDALLALPSVVSLADREVALAAETTGFRLSAEATATEALEVGRNGGIAREFVQWLGSFIGETPLTSTPSVDPDLMDAVFDEWDAELASGPAPGVRLEGLTAIPVYAEPHPVVDRPAAEVAVLELLSSTERAATVIPTTVMVPPMPDAEVDRAVALVRQLLAEPITLSRSQPEASITFVPTELAAALRFEASDTTIDVGLDPAFLDPLFDRVRDQFADTFQDARFRIDEESNTVAIEPGRPGVKVDVEAAAAELLAAANGDRIGDLPITDGAPPDVTAEYLESLGVEHLVSEFTTYHDCCQNRVVNIQLMADTVDGHLLLPGEQFSINGFVGERTAAKGYLPAGTIVDGEIVDTIGGGVSQFATTMYNAVFWGGYEDVAHKPHSIYFSRYPEGIEATVDFPHVDLVFRNDSEHAVLINTKYTSTSITVQLYGSNGGRVVSGDQRGGTTRLSILAEGDPAGARRVAGSVSDRHSITTPEVVYEVDDTLEPETERVVAGGRDGWSVTVVRTITEPGGTATEERWTVRYRSSPRIIAVHSCVIPRGEPGYTGEPCPTTTTSMIPPSTTTTTPSTTTTTVP